MKTLTYKGLTFYKSEVNGVVGYVFSENCQYPLSTIQDVKNKIDYELHYDQLHALNKLHDLEIDRIFN